MSLLPQIDTKIESTITDVTQIPSKTYKIVNDSLNTSTEFQEPTTVESNDIITIDTLGYDIVSVDKINGGSKQETRSNNLYNPETNVAGYLNQAGEIISNNNWVITDYIPVLEALDYYIAGNKNLTDGDGVYGAYYNADKELISTFPYSTYKTETTTITTPENCAYIKFSIYKYQDNTKTFDFYTNAPTPNYQSKVETVGSNVNLFDGIMERGSIDDTTGANEHETWQVVRSKNYIDVKGLKNITLSLVHISNTVIFYNSSKTVLSHSFSTTEKTRSVELPENCEYIRFYEWIVDLNSHRKIESGSKATPWSPHGMGSVEIDVGNKNLFDKNNMNIIDGSFINSATRKIESNANRKCFYIKINPNEHYTISREKIASTFIVGTTREIPVIGSDILDIDFNNNEITTILSSANAYYLVCYYKTKSTEVESDIVNNIQIEVGEQATEYVEHQSQTKIMPIQQEMLEGDYIEDVEHHGWKKIILTGNESYGFAETSMQPFRLNLSDAEQLTPSQDVAPNVYCSHFTPVAWNSSKTELEAWVTALVGKQLAFGYRDTTTLEDWKAYLAEQYTAGTPVTIYYKLATPIDLELTEEQKEVMNELNNIVVKNVPIHIYVNDNDLPIISVKYYTNDDIIYETVETDRIIGYVDNLDAVKQAIYHILAIERYAYLIYDDNYGVELEQYIGKDLEYIQATIEETLKEALTYDLRIIDVSVTNINKVSNDTVKIDMIVISIYGNIEMEVNVNV